MPHESLDLTRTAILLDIDGTLLDLAPTPHEVRVPSSLRVTLETLQEQTDGALALVSGRPLADIDLIFAPLRLPAIGGHGAEMRLSANGAAVSPHATPLDEFIKAGGSAKCLTLRLDGEDAAQWPEPRGAGDASPE